MEKKISIENARKIFETICKAFDFTVPEEAKTQKINIDVNGRTASIEQEVDNAKLTIEKIAQGVIEFNENAEDPKIIYHLSRPIKTETETVKSLTFGIWTRLDAKMTKLDIDGLTPGMSDEKYELVIKAMTKTSDSDVLDGMSLPQYNDLRSIVNYFLA